VMVGEDVLGLENFLDRGLARQNFVAVEIFHSELFDSLRYR
jgi:hypothetical protein